MIIDLKLLDQFSLTGRLSRNFATAYSEDNRFFILSSAGLYVIALKGYVSNPFSTLSCHKHYMEVSNFTPTSNMDMDINCFYSELKRQDLYETVMCNEYSANIKNTVPIAAVPLCAQWSPKGMIEKTQCSLGVLTNLYSLEIYAQYVDENELMSYCITANITQEIINESKKMWKQTEKLPINGKFNEFKNRIERVLPTSFTWSHCYKINKNPQNHCAIFAGHKNGDITIWGIAERKINTKEKSKIHYLGRYSTQLNSIISMHWHQTKQYSGTLSFSDTVGKMSVINVMDLGKAKAIIHKEVAFWTEDDTNAIDKITVLCHDGCTFVLLTKQCFLIVYGISKLGDVFDQKALNIGHFYITGLCFTENNIIALTLPGIIKQITISVTNGKIALDEITIPLKIDLSKYRTHGLFFSPNKIFCGLLAFPCHLREFNTSKTSFKVFIFQNTIKNPFELLWSNDTGSLSGFWDCFEILRLTCLKERRFPWLGLSSNLNYDELSLLQLKTLRLTAKMSEMIFNTVPVIKSYDLKPFILLHYLVEVKVIVKRLNRLLKRLTSGKELSLFQMRSVDVQIFFLKEVVVKDILAKSNVGRHFIEDVRHVLSIANEIRYPPMEHCVWCGEKIIGPTCLPPHADSRCSISMMPILLITAYKCPFCKTLVHEEVEKELNEIYCPYCDIAMVKRAKIDMNEKIKNIYSDIQKVKSSCFDDCLTDTVELSDVKKNNIELFSDSESEYENEESRFRKIYLRMSNVRLEEIIKMDNDG